jgi:hypothetical protein
MPYDPQNPLPKERLYEIDKRLGELGQAKNLLRRCVNCGMDMAREISDVEQTEARLTAIKREFFGTGQHRSVD